MALFCGRPITAIETLCFFVRRRKPDWSASVCLPWFVRLYEEIGSAYAPVVVCADFEIRHLFVSSGHNYFGHHEKPPGSHPTVEVDELQCIAGRGVTGDRFFGRKKDYKGQITFFEQETYQDLCWQFGVSDRGPEVFRRNVITRGARLNELIGVEFELQGIRFFGSEECRPCYWMDLAFASGAELAMRGRGGLRAEIRSDGFLRRSR